MLRSDKLQLVHKGLSFALGRRIIYAGEYTMSDLCGIYIGRRPQRSESITDGAIKRGETQECVT